MIALSAALRAGDAADPLHAIYVGSLREHEVEPFQQFKRASSNESFCDYMLRNLHRAFPCLGQTVRSWPRLAGELENMTPFLLPRVKTNQTAYRRQIHMSLWAAISELHRRGWTKGSIADLLARGGL